MRDRIERLVLLPFSIGCVSESSIEVGAQFPNRRKNNAKSTPISLSIPLFKTQCTLKHIKALIHAQSMFTCLGNHIHQRLTLFYILDCEGTKEDDHEEAEEYEDDEEILSDGNLKSPLSLLAVPKFQRLFKNFKNLSQFFVYKDDEMEEDDLRMEIGLPTDVKHVTHIGIDGSATSILSKGWDNLKGPDLPAAPVHLTASPDLLAMPAQVPPELRTRPPPVHLTPSPPVMPAEVPPDLPAPPPVHLTQPPLAMPAQLHQLNVKGA